MVICGKNVLENFYVGTGLVPVRTPRRTATRAVPTIISIILKDKKAREIDKTIKRFKLVRIKVIAVGKTKEGWIKQGISHYQKLLKKYVELKLVEIREEKITKSRDIEIILDAEAKRILRYVNKSSLGIALDMKGESLSSESFARLLEENLSRGYSEFVFILGGALGLSRRVLDACPIKLSLSRMTFTHEMSHVILLEQIYRAFSILKGTKYHK